MCCAKYQTSEIRNKDSTYILSTSGNFMNWKTRRWITAMKFCLWKFANTWKIDQIELGKTIERNLIIFDFFISRLAVLDMRFPGFYDKLQLLPKALMKFLDKCSGYFAKCILNPQLHLFNGFDHVIWAAKLTNIGMLHSLCRSLGQKTLHLSRARVARLQWGGAPSCWKTTVVLLRIWGAAMYSACCNNH